MWFRVFVRWVMPLHVIVHLHGHVFVHVCVPTDGCLQLVIALAHGWAHEDGRDKKMSPDDHKEEQQKARQRISISVSTGKRGASVHTAQPVGFLSRAALTGLLS